MQWYREIRTICMYIDQEIEGNPCQRSSQSKKVKHLPYILLAKMAYVPSFLYKRSHYAARCRGGWRDNNQIQIVVAIAERPMRSRVEYVMPGQPGWGTESIPRRDRHRTWQSSPDMGHDANLALSLERQRSARNTCYTCHLQAQQPEISASVLSSRDSFFSASSLTSSQTDLSA